MTDKLGINIDLNVPMPYDEYKEHWSNLYKVEIKLTDKIGECKHEQGDIYYYENPYKRPVDVCFALLHVLDLYVWRVVLGFPSWNEKAPSIYRVHCPDHTGTIRAITRRTRGRSIEQIISELRKYLTGWKLYYGIAQVRSMLRELDSWIKRRLRCYLWKQWGKSGYRQLRKRGVTRYLAWSTCKSAHGA